MHRTFKCRDLIMNLSDHSDGTSYLVVTRLQGDKHIVVDKYLATRQWVYELMASYYE